MDRGRDARDRQELAEGSEMNRRLKLKSLALKLRTDLDARGREDVHVGTGFDVDYMNSYEDKIPAVWFVGQTMSPADEGRGFSGLFMQKVDVDLHIRIVCKRYEDGDIDPEEFFSILVDLVADIMKDWTPQGAEKPLVWKSERDGPSADTFLSADIVFGTQVRYQRTVP